MVKKKAEKWVFQTANIAIEDDDKLIPGNGVYAVNCMVLGQQFHGMLNIGTRPTFGGEKKTIEVHILNFDKNIYGESISVIFYAILAKRKTF